MNILFRIIFFIIFFLINSYAKELNKVTLQLQWLDQFQFAGYYIAKEKGFYKNLDLDVKILKYQNDLNIIDDVVNKKATFATGRTSLLIHKNNGYPVVALAAIFQHSPAALLVTNKNIITPNDLINKKIMISPDAITSASYISMLFSEGVMENNFTVIKHTFNINDLISGKTDAIASYISNEPYKLKEKGIFYQYFHPKDYGFDFYGDILYTSKHMLQNNPEIVENFTNASLKGWEYAFANIEETAKLIFKKYNLQDKTVDSLIFEGKTLKKLAYGDMGSIGHISEDKFHEIAKIYRLLGLIKKDYSIDDFMYCVHCASKINLNNEEKQWIINNKNIKLGTNIGWNPIEFFDSENNYSGLTAGYLNLVEEKLNIKIKIEKNLYWHEMINKVKEKKLDMFLAIVETNKRKKFLNFTTPYLSFPTVIVTRDDVPYIKDLTKLKKKKIAVEKSFYTQELLSTYYKKIKLIQVNTTEDALKKVYNGEVYAYVGALPNIGYFIKKLKYTNLKVNGEASFDAKLSFASRKDLPILNSILQKTLNSITKEEHDKIYDNWINIQYPNKADHTMFIIAIIIIFIILFILYIRNIKLKKISETDSLTKIANRRKIDTFLEIEIERTLRNKTSLCVVMIDIDFFKKINDNYGHNIGDKILKNLAKVLKLNIRKFDLVGRWGGEEFLIVCPDNDISQTILLCKKLQKLISKIKVANTNNYITVSFGIAQFNKDEKIDNLINRADKELYNAKHKGRDCIYPLI